MKLLVINMVAMVYLELMRLHELLFLLALSSSHTLPYQNEVCQEHNGGKETRMNEIKEMRLALLKHV